MIKQLDAALTKVNKLAGVNMTIPKATKAKLKRSRYFTTAIGAGGLTVGIIGSSAPLFVLGAISMLSSIVTTVEIKKL
ncbi:hypothetical protein [Bacillus badius]|uniref:Phage protein n=1 Tax=Bacillus badius TaxID=1455 RepID=A0ABR5AR32_BACBA|nr:hypothetical protein [Bacillus badius]KIL77207.1 hypothetical protein SD77_1654 [Bacillus badius]KZO01054.1 hypothetical protein A4244_13570 [Bacillus badius]MED0668007.1 hypothetical protein [Bacillus badius]MED4717571.1 hypothetical protein [Bacillus badius]OCS89106.1 hypothetical protein A6M11_13590 [Bacillus badius]